MKNLFLCGKKYRDTILIIDAIKHGETNSCNKIIKKDGGLFNFLEISYKNWSLFLNPCGSKEAYIISDEKNSTRTSFVFNNEESYFTDSFLISVKDNCDWLHICYLDDLECFQEIEKLKIPYSVDFCTDTSRGSFIEIIKNAEIIFDSRERRQLYDNVIVKTPIILHDKNGFEIIQDSKIIHNERNIPIKNLNVNGAGDIFTGFFLENYYSLGLIESAKIAMTETTKTLKNR